MTGTRSTRGWLTLAVVLLSLGFCAQVVAAVKKWMDYDRLRSIERFLDAVYPPLQQHGGFLTMQTEEFNSSSSQLNLFFVQCWPGSGVPGGAVRADFLPHCSGNIGSVNSDFLRIIVVMGPARFPIHSFSADGKFVLEKQDEFIAEIKDHPDWKEPEKLDVLKKAGARFGPENKDDFLKTVPVDVVYEFSGCRLGLKTATFGADYGWAIQGTYRHGKKDYPCHASFEPFEGKLIGLDEL
jgi:hypothetical protein